LASQIDFECRFSAKFGGFRWVRAIGTPYALF
jgi:hypothetical protein